jgi:uncharacterized protein
MKCPSCKESTLVISERKGIEIDYCPDCRGIWLDRGELDKMLERSREEEGENRHVQQQSAPQGYPQYQKPYKRKKSLLEELFD